MGSMIPKQAAIAVSDLVDNCANVQPGHASADTGRT